MPPASNTVSADDARRLAEEAASSFDLGAVEFVRSGMNHVFRTSATVIRVSPPSGEARLQVARARRLTDAGIRVPAPLVGPIEHPRAVVTVWERIQTTGEPIDYHQLGATVARLHRSPVDRLTPDGPLPLYSEPPGLQVHQGLDAMRGSIALDPADLAVLRDACRQVQGWRDAESSADLVVCHGDVHPQNVLMADGQVVLVDWDTICMGPPEWDHVMLMTWSERWGGSRSDYEDFAAGYGADFRALESARRYAVLRLLAPTVNLAARARQDERIADELERRLQFWRGEPDPAVWTAQ